MIASSLDSDRANEYEEFPSGVLKESLAMVKEMTS